MGWQNRIAIGALLLPAMYVPVHAQSPAAADVAEEFDKLHFRSIGPATMSGRISDLAVYERNPAVYYVGTAHGGVWKTTSNGATYEPIFQHEGLISIGDVTISQRNPDLVWVGAGESNNRQSTSWGGGVWKSTDGGKTFRNMGLPNSYHINRIVIDPNNDDIVLVAATGPLFGPGGDRGVYRTTDGGNTWTNVLKVDDKTGANDLVISATDPKVIYASTYQRRRSACCMNGGGPGSAIWKSTDAGVTWTKLAGGGLPEGPLGRIALDAWRRDGNVVYATIEAPTPPRNDDDDDDEGGPGRGQRDQESGASGVYRSDDAGRTWRRVNTVNPRPMYFSNVRIDPTSADRVYMGGVGLHMTIDGGKTFATDAALVTHDDVHAIWIDPNNPDHILIGNDGGLAVSYDMSKTWTFIPNLPAGLFYHVSYDMETPFNVCGGMQDNYNWCGPSASRHRAGIFNYDWFQVQGGDGFVTLQDLRNPRMVFTESQNGNMLRRDKVTGESKSIRPSALNVVNYTKDDTYRWFWDTPIIFSPHDAGVLLVAANKVFRSTDRGDSWTVISPDLTTNADRDTIITMGVKNSDIRISRNDGISSWPTIVTLAESPKQAGVIYTGTDDGVVSVTRNNGETWENITARIPGFPAGGFVSEVVPSRFDAGTVYITADNHMNGDFKPYVWMSTDFGRTFRSLVTPSLRDQNVRTLTEDTRNADVLYIGTETGLFLTLDRGRTWRRMGANLPTVRIDEITIQPRDNAMIVATHGRALWILDNLAPIQEYAAAQRATADAALFTPSRTLQWKSKDDRNDEFWGHQFFIGENPPTDAVIHYLARKQLGDVRLRISDAAGKLVREITAPEKRRTAGIQSLCWDMRVEPIPTQQENAGQGERGERGGQGARGEQGARGGQAARGGRGEGERGGEGGRGDQAQRAEIPGVPTQLPTAGYQPEDPCATEEPEEGDRGRGGRGRFGGGANNGPHVVPGTYTVALLVDGRSVATKPLTIVMDPEVRLAGADRQRYNDLLVALHAAHERGAATAASLTSLGRQLADAKARVDSTTTVPAAAKTQLEDLMKQFEAIRVRFGVAAPSRTGESQSGQGGGRGFGRGNVDPANALGRLTSVKNGIMGVWEVPSAAVIRQSDDARAALADALAEAARFLARANTVSAALRPHGVTITVQPMQ